MWLSVRVHSEQASSTGVRGFTSGRYYGGGGSERRDLHGSWWDLRRVSIQPSSMWQRQCPICNAGASPLSPLCISCRNPSPRTVVCCQWRLLNSVRGGTYVCNEVRCVGIVWRNTSLEGVHGQRVAARGEDLADPPHLGVVRSKELLPHKEALFQVLEGLERLALLLHRGVHLVVLPEPLLEVLHIVGRHRRHTPLNRQLKSGASAVRDAEKTRQSLCGQAPGGRGRWSEVQPEGPLWDTSGAGEQKKTWGMRTGFRWPT